MNAASWFGFATASGKGACRIPHDEVLRRRLTVRAVGDWTGSLQGLTSRPGASICLVIFPRKLPRVPNLASATPQCVDAGPRGGDHLVQRPFLHVDVGVEWTRGSLNKGMSPLGRVLFIQSVKNAVQGHFCLPLKTRPRLGGLGSTHAL